MPSPPAAPRLRKQKPAVFQEPGKQKVLPPHRVHRAHPLCADEAQRRHQGGWGGLPASLTSQRV